MCPQPISEENPAALLIRPAKPWRLAEVEAQESFCLRVRFLDGTQGTVDMGRRIHAPDAGVFASLADPDLFRQVRLEYGAVTWPNEVDLAPDAMYRAIKASGTWVL